MGLGNAMRKPSNVCYLVIFSLLTFIMFFRVREMAKNKNVRFVKDG